MTKKEFRTSVSQRVKAIFKKTGLRYNLIDIKYSIPTVSIDYNRFFAQGESAEELIDTAQSLADKTGLNIKTCIVFWLDSAGAI
jgi:hypothetical protein